MIRDPDSTISCRNVSMRDSSWLVTRFTAMASFVRLLVYTVSVVDLSSGMIV